MELTAGSPFSPACRLHLKFDQEQPSPSHSLDAGPATGIADADLELARLLQQQELVFYNMAQQNAPTADPGLHPLDTQLTDEEIARRMQAEEEMYAGGDYRNLEQHLEAVPDVDALQYQELQALGDAVGTVSKGLEAQTLECLPSQAFHALPPAASTLDRCCICQDEFEGDDDVTLLPGCQHIYHRNCIKQWLSTNKTCPYCNKEVTAPQIDGKQQAQPA